MKLERSVIKKDYKINIQGLGVRTANLLIGVGKGGSEEQEKLFKNIIRML
jgi:hypothetical protein